jgi:hypothetical protein
MTLTVPSLAFGHVGVAPVAGDGDPLWALPTVTVLLEVLMTFTVLVLGSVT